MKAHVILPFDIQNKEHWKNERYKKEHFGYILLIEAFVKVTSLVLRATLKRFEIKIFDYHF